MSKLDDKHEELFSDSESETEETIDISKSCDESTYYLDDDLKDLSPIREDNINSDFSDFVKFCNEKQRQKNKLKLDRFYYSNTLFVKEGDEQFLKLTEIYQAALFNDISQECKITECVPYYDVERYYKTNKERVNDWSQLLNNAYDQIICYYGSNAKIYICDASGKTDKLDDRKYKNSFHFIVRGCGYHENPSEIYKFSESFGFDNSVYKPKNQKFRLLNSNSTDKQNRRLRIVNNYPDDPEISDEKPTYDEFINYVIQNTNGEELRETYKEEQETKKEQTKKDNKIINDNITEDNIKELLLCFINNNLEWDQWIKIIWLLYAECTKRGYDTYEVIMFFSKMSSKHNENETVKAINNALSHFQTDKKLLGIGTLIKMAREYNPEEFKKWARKNAMKYKICHRDPYIFHDFYKYYSETVFESEYDLINSFKNDINKVMALVLSGHGLYIKKDNINDGLFSKMYKISELLNFNMRYKITLEVKEKAADKKKREKEGNMIIPIETIIKSVKFSSMANNYINKYSSIVFSPDSSKLKDHEFNSFRGFIAEEVRDVDNEKIKPVLDVLYNVWANKNDELYNYFLSWFANMIQNPSQPGRTTLFIHGKPGSGKNSISEFIKKFVIGKHGTFTVNSIQTATQKHNDFLDGVKFGLINELKSDEFSTSYGMFDQFKTMITEDEISIEPKCEKRIMIQNYICWLLFSNHWDAIKLEKNDRRYICAETSNIYVGNSEYWKGFYKSVMNQDTGNHFYTFLKRHKICNLMQIPKTELRDRIIKASSNSAEHFIDYFKENLEMDYIDRDHIFKLCISTDDGADKNKIKASYFYDAYKSYCNDKGFKGMFSNIKFSSIVAEHYEKCRLSTGNNAYLIK
jgi:hypothetical protein